MSKPSTHYFEADCPVCEHRLELCYAYDSEEGAYDPAISNAGACICLLGQDWLEDALDAHLDSKYHPTLSDFLP
jgi:hypothetical protein